MTLAQYSAAMQALSAVFREAYRAAVPEPGWDSLVTAVPSATRETVHTWLTPVSGMGLWVGGKRHQSPLAAAFTVPNLDFEGTVDIDRNDLEDDQLGGYGLLVQQMAADAAFYPIKLLQLLIANGTATTMTLRGESVSIAAWDGKALFAGARKIGKDTAQTNLVTGTGVTYDKVVVDFFKARMQMAALKNGSGEALGRIPSTVVIPPNETLAAAFQTIVGGNVPDGTPKIGGMIDRVLVNPQWSGNDWALFDTSRVVRAIMTQMRQQPTLRQAAPNSEGEFERRLISTSVEGRFACVPADWTCAALVQNSD